MGRRMCSSDLRKVKVSWWNSERNFVLHLGGFHRRLIRVFIGIGLDHQSSTSSLVLWKSDERSFLCLCLEPCILRGRTATLAGASNVAGVRVHKRIGFLEMISCTRDPGFKPLKLSQAFPFISQYTCSFLSSQLSYEGIAAD